MTEMTHVDGKDRGKVTLYALSTCVWCKKTKGLLDSLGVAYDYVFVDRLNGRKRRSAEREMEAWNPRGSFPTLVVGQKTIVGYREKEIREALDHE